MGTLVNAIKALFTSKKTTDSNYAVALLNKSDASPAGYMELPDLAAVAAGSMIPIANNSSLNNYTNSGVYYTNSATNTNTISERPFSGAAMVLRVFNPYGGGAKNCIQICLCFLNNPQIYFRLCYGSGWTEWKILSMEQVS